MKKISNIFLNFFLQFLPYTRFLSTLNSIHRNYGVWIGFNVSILPGVKIGKKSIIGAGSVVVNDIPDHSIAVGNPCKVIKQL